MTTLVPSSHAVSRSSELLSCARTALKIAQSSNLPQEQQWLLQVSPNDLCLNSSSAPDHNHVETLIEDGVTLLRQMKQSLTTLSALVKRRGHTNDPTQEISAALEQFQEDAKELAAIKIIPTPLISKQQARHYDFVSGWLQAVASQQAAELKEIMKVRGSVLQDQAQRRKLLNPSTNAKNARRNTSAATNIDTAFNSPLFTVTNMNGTNGHAVARQSSFRPPPPLAGPVNGSGTSSSAPSSYGGYASGYGGSGYGSSGYGSTGYGGGGGQSIGMRQRKATNNNNTTATTAATQEIDMQVQIQERQARRQTQSRLESARQAESTLAELGMLFGKMSTLIVQQGEVLEKVEDDVEAALGHVTEGEQEIQTLYSIKKGNRALILKVFAILIFFIIFMRLY